MKAPQVFRIAFICALACQSLLAAGVQRAGMRALANTFGKRQSLHRVHWTKKIHVGALLRTRVKRKETS